MLQDAGWNTRTCAHAQGGCPPLQHKLPQGAWLWKASQFPVRLESANHPQRYQRAHAVQQAPWEAVLSPESIQLQVPQAACRATPRALSLCIGCRNVLLLIRYV